MGKVFDLLNSNRGGTGKALRAYPESKIEEYVRKQIAEAMESKLGKGYQTYANAAEQPPLTEENMRKAIETIETLFPVLYYHVTKFLDPGAIVKVAEQGSNPAYILVHPDNLEQVKKILGRYRTLKPLDLSSLTMKFPGLRPGKCHHGRIKGACLDCFEEEKGG